MNGTRSGDVVRTFQKPVIIRRDVLSGVIPIPTVLWSPEPRQSCLTLSPSVDIGNGGADLAVAPTEMRIALFQCSIKPNTIGSRVRYLTRGVIEVVSESSSPVNSGTKRGRCGFSEVRCFDLMHMQGDDFFAKRTCAERCLSAHIKI